MQLKNNFAISQKESNKKSVVAPWNSSNDCPNEKATYKIIL